MTRLIERWFPCAEVSEASHTGWGSGNSESSLWVWFAKCSRPEILPRLKEWGRGRRIGGLMPGRSPHEVVLSEVERAELEHRAACYTRPHREVQRAKLVLLAAEGKTNVEIGGLLGMGREAVSRWRRRFCERRLAGLEDQKRTGRPRRFPPGRGRPSQGGGVRAAAAARRPDLAVLAR